MHKTANNLLLSQIRPGYRSRKITVLSFKTHRSDFLLPVSTRLKMGLSKSKDSYDVSSLTTKIEEENAYGSIREEEPNLYSQFRKSANERDIDVINKNETRKDKVIRFGPEKRNSIPTGDRSNTPASGEYEDVVKEIVEKVKSGGAVEVSKSEIGEVERRCSIDENPVAPIEQLIEDFERRNRKDSTNRRGSYLGRIYTEKSNGNETQEALDEANLIVEIETVNGQQHNLNGIEDNRPQIDPLEEVEEARIVATQRRVSYRDKAEFFAEDAPRKDSIETQPLGHRQSIKEDLIEEFNSSLHNIESNRTDFVHSMLQVNTNPQESNRTDPLDDQCEFESKYAIGERKKSDPLDVREPPNDEIMKQNFENVRPLNETASSSSLNIVDNQKAKSGYGLKGEIQIPLNTIREIKMDATKLRKTVEEFEGSKADVHYVYLNEMLLRCLIKLDSVNVGDDDMLKQERRNVVDYVQDCICLLDSRAEGDEPDIEVAF